MFVQTHAVAVEGCALPIGMPIVGSEQVLRVAVAVAAAGAVSERRLMRVAVTVRGAVWAPQSKEGGLHRAVVVSGERSGHFGVPRGGGVRGAGVGVGVVGVVGVVMVRAAGRRGGVGDGGLRGAARARVDGREEQRRR